MQMENFVSNKNYYADLNTYFTKFKERLEM